jgi:hypothetical protein
MARKAVTKTSNINRTTHGSFADLERYCRGLAGWPRSWMGWEKDLPPGEKLVACFRPFLEHLISSVSTTLHSQVISGRDNVIGIGFTHRFSMEG